MSTGFAMVNKEEYSCPRKGIEELGGRGMLELQYLNVS
jgi:hypothetical protein